MAEWQSGSWTKDLVAEVEEGRPNKRGCAKSGELADARIVLGVGMQYARDAAARGGFWQFALAGTLLRFFASDMYYSTLEQKIRKWGPLSWLG